MTDTLVAEQPVKNKKTHAEKRFEKQKATVKAAIVAATEQLKKKNYENSVNGGLDAQQIKIATDLQNISSIYGSTSISIVLARILSECLGKPITNSPPAGKSLIWVRFAAIVVLNQGGHNYPVGKIVIITQDQKGFREDGTYGNTLDNNHMYYRPATSEDLDKITNETYAALIREFLVMA